MYATIKQNNISFLRCVFGLLFILFTFAISSVASASYCANFDTIANSVGSLGYDSNNLINAQSFVSTSTGCYVDNIYINYAKSGSPTGNISVALYTDSAGSPNTIVATSTNTISSSTITTSAQWLLAEFNNTTYLATSTKYWIVISTPNNSTTNYYLPKGSTGETGQENLIKDYIGSAWIDKSNGGTRKIAYRVTAYDPNIYGCLNSTAINYNVSAIADDGSCYWYSCNVRVLSNFSISTTTATSTSECGGGLDSDDVRRILDSEMATTTQMLGSVNFGLSIIIVILFVVLLGFIFNNLNSKKPWHS